MDRIDRMDRMNGDKNEMIIWVCGTVGLWDCGTVGLWDSCGRLYDPRWRVGLLFWERR